MRSTSPLRAAPPRYPLDIHPLAHLHPDGRFELLQAAFPPLGPLMLALWMPGEEPSFRLVTGRLDRGWRWRGPSVDAYVVAWEVSTEDPTQPL